LASLNETGRGNHEALFLPVLVGRGHRCLGHLLVASRVGQMGGHRRSRDPCYHEPFLPDVLLPELEESRSGAPENLSPKASSVDFSIRQGRNLSCHNGLENLITGLKGRFPLTHL
jgi:hypothetical protein